MAAHPLPTRPNAATLRQLRAFVAVAQDGSITRAAQRLHLTPSALSMLVSGLESELGVRLFERTTRRLTLTDPGRELLPTVAAVFAQLDTAFEILRAELPAGVPVMIRSPGANSTSSDKLAMTSGTDQISLERSEVCVTLPFTLSSILPLDGSIPAAGTSRPMGADLSKPLPISQGRPVFFASFWMSRRVISKPAQ